jgi:hypothetical protein
MEVWGIDTMGKAFGDSNRLNLQKLDSPQWHKNKNNSVITEIIYEELSKNERLRTDRIDKIIDIVKNRIKVL